MGRQSRKQTGERSDLLNFHFSPPPTQGIGRGGQQGRGGRGSSKHHPNYGRRNNRSQQKNAKQDRRTKEDRASVRQRPSSAMFYLHSSPDHAFVISRLPWKQRQYSFEGADSPVSWESVRVVKSLSAASEQEGCPICLESFCCARITKCGHSFCLPCLIRHVHSFAANNPYADYPKCPCCAVPLHLEDVRPVQVITVKSPTINQYARFVKLFRKKDSPCPFLPLVNEPRRSSPHSAPCETDADAPYCKFNYVDPHVYQNHLRVDIKALETMETSDDNEILCKALALDTVKKELSAALMEADEETSLMERFQAASAGIYQPHPDYLIANNYSSKCIVSEEEGVFQFDVDESSGAKYDTKGQTGANDSHSEARRYRGDSIGSERSLQSAANRRTQADSVGSEPSVHDTEGQRKPRGNSVSSIDCTIRSSDQQITQGGTMYLDSEEVDFYQSEDGQLCYLSGFNMSCLRKEFSTYLPEVQSDSPDPPKQRRFVPQPLPDSLEGKVLEVERFHLTAGVRQRFKFLSHLPLYSDICMVEIHLGNVLSIETKKAFKKEFQKRNQTRIDRAKAEKREDRRAKRIEEERINELKSRIQRIDPSDEFFHVSPEPDSTLPTGEEYGPALSTAGTGRADTQAQQSSNPPPSDPNLSFSAICKSGGAFPSLSSPKDEFPALGASPTSTNTAQQGWGRPPSSPKPVAPSQRVASLPSPEGKKKSKGKKIVLFSTGGHRGTSY